MPAPDSTRSTPLGDLALLAAQAAVVAIRDVHARGVVDPRHKSGAHDLVTEADKAAEKAVFAVISSARPDDALLGEETGARAGTSGTRWLVDPLDGTANFVYGRNDYAVSVAAEVEGRITAGAIIRPADGRWAMAEDETLIHGLWDFSAGEAALDRSSAADARPAPPTAGIDEALIAFGFPYAKPARQQALRIVNGLVPAVRGIRIMGSAACDLLAVALGESDAFVGFGLAEWDTAAGQALVTAAGGSVSRLRIPHFDLLIAGRAPLVGELSALIAGIAAATG